MQDKLIAAIQHGDNRVKLFAKLRKKNEFAEVGIISGKYVVNFGSTAHEIIKVSQIAQYAFEFRNGLVDAENSIQKS